MEKVERKRGLMEEAAPKVKRKSWVTAAEAGDQVILVSLDRSFGGVGAMEVRADKLKVNALLMHELLQDGRALIVQHLEERVEATVTEVGLEDLVGTVKFLCAA